MRTVIVPFYGYLRSKVKRFWNLTKLAKKTGLYFSSHDEVGANIIALDEVKRKLLYTKKTHDVPSYLIVDLNNLEACTIRKEYNSINAGELNKKRLPHFLKSVFLNLVFKNGSGTVTLPLFDAQKEQQGNVEQLEAQAKKWQGFVSKLLPTPVRERA